MSKHLCSCTLYANKIKFKPILQKDMPLIFMVPICDELCKQYSMGFISTTMPHFLQAVDRVIKQYKKFSSTPTNNLSTIHSSFVIHIVTQVLQKNNIKIKNNNEINVCLCSRCPFTSVNK